jgi:hypothetical protein
MASGPSYNANGGYEPVLYLADPVPPHSKAQFFTLAKILEILQDVSIFCFERVPFVVFSCYGSSL